MIHPHRRTPILLALAAACLVAASAADAALIAHYTFDADNAGTTPDSIGANFATLGSAVAIDTTGGVPLVGAGALNITSANETSGTWSPSDGAVTSNSFTWASDARTLVFWWRVKSPNTDTSNGAYVSMGDNAANGTRFEVKETSGATLRVEVQGTGANSNPAIDNGSWHMIAVTVPDSATFADVAWYVDGGLSDLNTSGNTLAIATSVGPLVFGDSVYGGAVSPTNRSPNGYLDDFQLYDRVLSTSEIASLFNNPGTFLDAPTTQVPAPAALPTGLALLALTSTRRRRRR